MAKKRTLCRPQSHLVDEDAQECFKRLLPKEWVKTPLTPDYAKDFLVGVWKYEAPTGAKIFAQLKGKKNAKLICKGAYATYSLENHYADYYLKLDLPVFLFLVDVSRQVGYWVFLQQYLKETPPAIAKCNSESVTIRLPTSNLITDSVGLENAIADARQYLIDSRAASVSGSLRAEKMRFQKLDQRFDVQPFASENETVLRLVPKEDFSVGVLVKGQADELDAKLYRLFGQGLPTQFRKGEIEIFGSTLLSTIFEAGGVLHVEHAIDAVATLLVKSASDEVLGKAEYIPGTLTGGHSELRFESCSPGSPLWISFTSKKEGHDGPINLRFDIRKWRGRELLSLPYFNQLAGFFIATRTAAKFEMRCQILGNDALAGNSEGNLLEQFRAISTLFLILRDAQNICRKVNINPLMNDRIDSQLGRKIFTINQLLEKGEWVWSVPGEKVRCNWPKDTLSNLLSMTENSTIGVKITGNEITRETLFGEEFELGRIEHEFSELKLVSSRKKLQSQLTTKKSTVNVEFLCTENSLAAVRKLAT